MHLNSQIAARRLRRIRGRARRGAENRVAAPAVPCRKRGETVPVSPSGGVEQDSIPAEGERRSTSRVALSCEVMVRRIGGFNFEVALRDLSTAGCRVELLDPCEAGDSVIARFPQLEPLGSRVCWTEGVTTGMQFLTSIHPAVFQSLLARLSDSEAVAA